MEYYMVTTTKYAVCNLLHGTYFQNQEEYINGYYKCYFIITYNGNSYIVDT